MRIESLFSEELACQSESMPIISIDGEDTGETLQVKTTRSIETTRAHHQQVAKTGRTNCAAEPEVVQSLITGWSLEDDCTVENKVKLLEQAPYILTQVLGFSASMTERVFSKKKT